MMVGVPMESPDLLYASGFRAVDPVVLLDKGGDRTLVVSSMESGRAARECPGVRVMDPRSLNLGKLERGRLSSWALRLMRLNGVTSVSVGAMFPIGVARRLERAGMRLRVMQGALFPERLVKRPDEVSAIAESQQAAVIAMRAAMRMIGDSTIDAGSVLRLERTTLTAETVRRTIERVLLDHDCTGHDIIVACGEYAADPHAVGEGPLLAGRPIVLDIFPRHQRHAYWGDLTRTVVRGRATPELRRLYSAVRAAQLAALEAVRPGVRCRTVHARAVRVFEERGFRTGVKDGQAFGFIHGTGHGVGLAIHEGPTLAPSGETRLRSGNVVTVEPGLYYPGLGGVRIEDTVLVTAHGWRYLAPCEKRFEL
jgi:Xaa-Pro aminopeptidase